MSRSYSHETCRDCGGRTSNNGMGRDAHAHSERHIQGLRQRAREATTDSQRQQIELHADKLAKELSERKARRQRRHRP